MRVSQGFSNDVIFRILELSSCPSYQMGTWNYSRLLLNYKQQFYYTSSIHSFCLRYLLCVTFLCFAKAQLSWRWRLSRSNTCLPSWNFLYCHIDVLFPENTLLGKTVLMVNFPKVSGRNRAKLCRELSVMARPLAMETSRGFRLPTHLALVELITCTGWGDTGLTNFCSYQFGMPHRRTATITRRNSSVSDKSLTIHFKTKAMKIINSCM